MVNNVTVKSRGNTIGESEGFAYGYKQGLSAGIFNTLLYLENSGYIRESEFFNLKSEIEAIEKGEQIETEISQ